MKHIIVKINAFFKYFFFLDLTRRPTSGVETLPQPAPVGPV